MKSEEPGNPLISSAAASAEPSSARPASPQGDKALIYKGELEIMARFVRDYPDMETGGDLFGFWTHTGSPVVEYVLGPGDDADHAGAEFHPDASFLRKCGAVLRDLHGLQHVGTWHSHHRLGLTEPSSGDSATMQKAVDNRQFSGWMLAICNFRDHEELVEIRSYLYRPGREGAHTQLTWIVLPGTSPVRGAMASANGFPSAEPHAVTSTYEAIPSTTFAVISTPQTTVNPTFPSTSFLATTEGRAELFRLNRELADVERGVEILQREDGRVSLAFCRDGYAFEIVFPHAYPVVKPVIEYRPCDIPEGQEESWLTPRTLFVSMNRGDDVVAAAEDLIRSFLDGHSHGAGNSSPLNRER